MANQEWKINVTFHAGKAALQQTITYGSREHVTIAWSALVETWLALARLEAATGPQHPPRSDHARPDLTGAPATSGGAEDPPLLREPPG